MAINWEQYKSNSENTSNTDWEQYRSPIKNDKPSQKRNILQMLSELPAMISQNPLNPVQQVKAIPKIASDIISYIPKGLEKLSNAPSEISGAYNMFQENPKQAMKSLLAGFPELGHELINTPSSMLSGLIRYGLAPKELEGLIPTQEQFLKRPFEEDVKKTFGLTGQPGEELLKGIVPNIQNVVGGAKLINKIASADIFKKIDFNNAISNLVKKHDIKKDLSSKEFTDIKNEAYSRGVNNIPNTKSIVDKIEQKGYLPETKAFERLLNNAKNEDYNALRDLQDDLGELGSSHLSSKLQADRYKGMEMLDLRNDINTTIKNHFKNLGHNDLADRLTNAIKEHKDFMNTYYNVSSRTATPSSRVIAKIVDPYKRLKPKNPQNVFSEESKYMEKLTKEHPEIIDVMKKYKNKKSQSNFLKKVGVPIGLTGAGIVGTNWLMDKLLRK